VEDFLLILDQDSQFDSAFFLTFSNASRELLEYAIGKDLRTKIIFVNDGPGLLLGSMWDDYSYIEEASDDIKVVTLRMITERITPEWLNS
jgi:hypothetical protein